MHRSVSGGSHVSPCAGSTTPSPQLGAVQSVRQWSGRTSELAAPSSHSSPSSTTPLPHTPGSIVQSPLQPSPSVWFPSSHSSPSSTTPLPHTPGSTVQSAAQPSPSVWFPSSHSSSESTTPSPQRGSVQSVRQWSGRTSELSAPSSHSSSPSISPLPHAGDPRQRPSSSNGIPSRPRSSAARGTDARTAASTWQARARLWQREASAGLAVPRSGQKGASRSRASPSSPRKAWGDMEVRPATVQRGPMSSTGRSAVPARASAAAQPAAAAAKHASLALVGVPASAPGQRSARSRQRTIARSLRTRSRRAARPTSAWQARRRLASGGTPLAAG